MDAANRGPMRGSVGTCVGDYDVDGRFDLFSANYGPSSLWRNLGGGRFEDVAAAVVLKEGLSAGERELRDFVAGRLADFKVPRRILFLAEIPKGATGKLQRIGLAAKLGLTA